MPLHPIWPVSMGVSILYTQPHTFTFQINFHTQDRMKEKNKIERKTLLWLLKQKQKQNNPPNKNHNKTKENDYKGFLR